MRLIPLKYLATSNPTSLPENTNPDFIFRYCDVSSVNAGKLTLPDKLTTFSAAPSRARRITQQGDIVFSTVRPYLKAVAQVPRCSEPLVFSTGFSVIHPMSNTNSRFMYWALQGDQFVNESTRWADGVSYPAITDENLMRIRLAAPNLSEQRRIARFLDEETAKIDNLIEKHTKLKNLALVQEEARWHRVFTRFDARSELPLKRVLRKLDRPAFNRTGVITAFRDGQVTLRSNRREDGFTFSETEDGYQGIEPGDLVYHGLDGFAGAVGVSDSRGNGSPVYHVCQPIDPNNNVNYLAAYLRFLGLSGFLATQAPNVRQRSVDFRNWETFSRIPFRLPAPIEQDRIVDKLQRYQAERQSAERLSTKAIDVLRERRSALITAAVTGQIEV